MHTSDTHELFFSLSESFKLSRFGEFLNLLNAVFFRPIPHRYVF